MLESLPSFWVSELERKRLGFSWLSFPRCLSLVLLLKKLSGFDGEAGISISAGEHVNELNGIGL